LIVSKVVICAMPVAIVAKPIAHFLALGSHFVTQLAHLLAQLADRSSLLQLGLPQDIETLGMGTQLGTDLRNITIGARCQHASRRSIGLDESDLLTKLSHVVLKTGETSFGLIIRHGSDPIYPSGGP
jgi:hypothetical protein